MKRLYLNLLAVSACLAASINTSATGWPEDYQGVMLQAFSWDSYSDTKWTNLEKHADELSKYFSLIWVPNSGKSGSGQQMGYSAQYWFTNHNSSFGTESELRSMIATYKSKGVGIIEDVILNHRNGVGNWYAFPTEVYNGKTYTMAEGSICSTDEVWKDGGHGCPETYKGAPDTGDDFNGLRDLDHTNPTVQEHIKDYCTFLLEDLGYVGFRLDMVKGYKGEYTKLYNQHSKPKFCVGEYWENSYSAVSRWIESTDKESAAFDFPFKYALNNAFSKNDMTQLTAKSTKTGTYLPKGLIHYGYSQFAVTFIDNHDTFRDNNKFAGDVLAANAFMLCSPGTPCVFLPHYKDNPEAIQTLINIRNSVGLHNMSEVNTLIREKDCYMAEVSGKNGKLVVRIGSSDAKPDGYTDSDIKASGNSYCVWTKTAITGEITESSWNPADDDPGFYVYLKNTKSWQVPYIHYWGGKVQTSWPGIPMKPYKDDIWKCLVSRGTTGIIFNAGDGDASKTPDLKAAADHLYSAEGSDEGVYAEADGILDVTDDDIAPVEYYNVQGIRIEQPSSGLYIVRRGKQVSKIHIK